MEYKELKAKATGTPFELCHDGEGEMPYLIAQDGNWIEIASVDANVRAYRVVLLGHQHKTYDGLLEALIDLTSLYHSTKGHDPNFVAKAKAAIQAAREVK